MKPDCPVARRSDYNVRACSFAEGAALIRANHYAGGCANTATHMHGLFRRDTGALVGAAQWLPPTRVAAESVAGTEWRRVLSLSRVVVLEGEPQNATSLLVGRSVRLVARDGRWVALVTYADESQGHTGGIYRATNWRYMGRTKPEPRWLDADGKQVSRKATKSRTAEQMRNLGYAMSGRFSKHKFVLRTGTP